jgi:hypothetical protein
MSSVIRPFAKSIRQMCFSDPLSYPPYPPSIGLLLAAFSVTLTKLPAVPPPHLLSLLSRF